MEYKITIQGKGGHGSRPDNSINPVDCFAAVYGALQSIACKISFVDGGTANNVIPDALHFICTCEDPDAMKRIVEHTCTAYNCTFYANAIDPA